MHVKVIPAREASDHWNVLKFMEQGPCTDCVHVVSTVVNPDGSTGFNVQIKHPFTNKNLTGFDVRGIVMLNGSHSFSGLNVTMSNHAMGDGELVNADGYTLLYTPDTEGDGPGGLQGYLKGKMATKTYPNATLNGYKRHISSDPANTRNAFYAGDSITVKYDIAMPTGKFVFGYAVDASWVPATNKPVQNPMTDFPTFRKLPGTVENCG